jgi:hypothetical protein
LTPEPGIEDTVQVSIETSKLDHLEHTLVREMVHRWGQLVSQI